MGYMRHDAIVVTSWDSEAIEEAAAKAREYGLEVLGPSEETTNGIRTRWFAPMGVKKDGERATNSTSGAPSTWST